MRQKSRKYFKLQNHVNILNFGYYPQNIFRAFSIIVRSNWSVYMKYEKLNAMGLRFSGW
jgi:hypothetical protein